MVQTGLGLDIGSSAVKMIQIRQQRDQLELTNFARVPLPAGMVNSGIITNPVAVAEAIRKARSQARIQEKKVIVAVGGESIIIKHLKLPVITGPELNKVIKSEMERVIPFPIDEATYDWDILNQSRDGNEMEVMVVAAPNQVIHSQIECLKKAGLTPMVIDIQPLSNLRALGIGPQTLDRETVGGMAIIDIGAGSTQMVIFNEGSIRVTRIISIAGLNFTRVIAEQLQISTEKAVAQKYTAGDALYNFNDNDPDSESYQVNWAIRPVLEELVVEIKRSLDYFKLQFRGQAVNAIILTGGSSKLRNFSQFLEDELHMAVRLGDPLANLRLNLRQSDYAAILGNPLIFSVSIGLALKGVGKE